MLRKIILFILFITTVVTFAWMITSPNFETVGAFLGVFATFLGDFIVERQSKNKIETGTQEEISNHLRQKMLRNAKQYWISNLYKGRMFVRHQLEIPRKFSPESVIRPWNLEKQANQMTLFEIFEHSNGKLLILGLPGSGKTTAMLEILKHMINQVEINIQAPFPVFLHLSSWQNKQKTIFEWAIEIIQSELDLSGEKVRQLLGKQNLILFFDGLDEVDIKLRQKCVQEINKFRKENPSIDILVSSRLNEYENLNCKLDLNVALILEPLSSSQASNNLSTLGIQNPTRALIEIAQTPLFLNILARSNSEFEKNNLATRSSQNGLDPNTRAKLSALLFKDYFENSLLARGTPKYSFQDAKLWLRWLAIHIRGNKTFYLDEINDNWLYTSKERNTFFFMLLSFCFIFSFSSGALQYLQFLYLDKQVNPIAKAFAIFFNFLTALLITSSSTFLDTGQSYLPSFRTLVNSRTNILFKKIFNFKNFFITLCILVTVFVFGNLISGNGIYYVLLSLFVSIVVFLLIYGIYSRFLKNFWLGQIKENEIQKHRASNQEKIGYVVLIYGVIGVLAFLIYSFDRERSILSIIAPLYYVGTCTAFLIGGGELLYFYLIRLVLFLQGSTPLKFRKFLDYTVDRGLMVKIGNGYKFYHELLQAFLIGRWSSLNNFQRYPKPTNKRR